jgi:Transglycosylase SLT domain
LGRFTSPSFLSEGMPGSVQASTTGRQREQAGSKALLVTPQKTCKPDTRPAFAPNNTGPIKTRCVLSLQVVRGNKSASIGARLAYGKALLMTAIKNFSNAIKVFSKDVAQGCFEIAHNGFAMLGLVAALAIVALVFKPELRNEGETALLGWLQDRQTLATAAEVPIEADAIDRATATDPKDLPKQQAAVAFWLSKKYRVAPEPIGALVAEAYEIGGKTKLDPTLILAIMAVESSFNPFAQSPVGAQGLMQVMTKIHTDKYQGFGGNLAAFDPVTNLRVGVKVLQECILRAGSVEGGLRQYVGASSDATEGGYTAKVLAEQSRLRQVADGGNVPIVSPSAPVQIPAIAPTQPTPVNDAEAEKVAVL